MQALHSSITNWKGKISHGIVRMSVSVWRSMAWHAGLPFYPVEEGSVCNCVYPLFSFSLLTLKGIVWPSQWAFLYVHIFVFFRWGCYMKGFLNIPLATLFHPVKLFVTMINIKYIHKSNIDWQPILKQFFGVHVILPFIKN